MQKKLLSLAITALVSNGALSVHADTTLQFEAGQTGNNTVMVKDGTVRMVMPGPQGEQVSLFDSKGQTFTMLNAQDKSYMVMDINMIREQAKMMQQMREQMMAQAQERMKQLSPEQRQQVEQQMARMGMGPKAQQQTTPEFSTRKTGKTETVNGIKCELYDSLKDGQPVGQACVASAKAIGMSSGDYTTLRAMFDFTQQMAKEFAGSSGGPTPPNPLGAFEQVQGLPIKVSGPSGQVMILSSVSNDSIAPEYFTIPAGFQKTDMSQMMGGTGAPGAGGAPQMGSPSQAPAGGTYGGQAGYPQTPQGYGRQPGYTQQPGYGGQGGYPPSGGYQQPPGYGR